MNHSYYDKIPPNNEGLPFSYMIHRHVNLKHDTDLLIPKWHEELEIKLILSGHAEVRCGTNVYLIQPGDIVVINSCELHSMYFLDAEDVCYHMLMISPKQLYSDKFGESILPVFDGSIRFRHIIHDDAYCQELLYSLFDELNAKEEAYALASIGMISTFLAYLLRNTRDYATNEELYQETRQFAGKLEPSFLYIHAHYHTEIKVEALAEMCDLSTYYFHHIFKKVTGKTVVTYINELRVNKAEYLIKNTSHKIFEIARMVGFTNNSYFHRVFRKHKGYNPTSCRNENIS